MIDAVNGMTKPTAGALFFMERKSLLNKVETEFGKLGMERCPAYPNICRKFPGNYLIASPIEPGREEGQG